MAIEAHSFIILTTDYWRVFGSFNVIIGHVGPDLVLARRVVAD